MALETTGARIAAPHRLALVPSIAAALAAPFANLGGAASPTIQLLDGRAAAVRTRAPMRRAVTIEYPDRFPAQEMFRCQSTRAI